MVQFRPCSYQKITDVFIGAFNMYSRWQEKVCQSNETVQDSEWLDESGLAPPKFDSDFCNFSLF